ncbi:hypothetical protein PSOLA_02880 [Candidatus Phytoplasma solani]|uniref:Uncharacterized protein n=1 Tax=Candidatus Phytoplasma solani TaxID=69896 RepID=A0A421NUS6_9MOLU|nr:hypothetical protein PSSA1_v1c5470 [Candidatus Phytoplasma solani]
MTKILKVILFTAFPIITPFLTYKIFNYFKLSPETINKITLVSITSLILIINIILFYILEEAKKYE